jgi:hypothetical protein
MKKCIKIWVTWIVGKIQNVGATVDPEILQWPGGGLIAVLLLIYSTAAMAVLSARGSRPQIA